MKHVLAAATSFAFAAIAAGQTPIRYAACFAFHGRLGLLFGRGETRAHGSLRRYGTHPDAFYLRPR